jgi:hypothetical protein
MTTGTSIKPWKILRIEESPRLFSHHLHNALVDELSEIWRVKLLFAFFIVVRIKPLTLIRLPDRFAIERYFAMEVLTSICCCSKRTSRLLALHIHGLHHFSVRINLEILRASS